VSTTTQDHTFGAAFLEEILNWIAENLDPEEVFGVEPLREWTATNFEPGEVYTLKTLSDCAESNGYTKEQE
jgi:hypothetical protein